MDKIVALVSSAPHAGGAKKDDNFVDRLSSRYTVIMLVVFAVVVTTQMYVGSAITCWMPQHFTGSHSKYTNSYCWVRNTYYLPFEHEIPRANEHHKRQVLPYYQWIPFILLGQAMFFYLPSIVWHGLNQKAGVDADNILQSAVKLTKTIQTDARGHKLKLVTNQFHRFLSSRVQHYYQGCSCSIQHIFTNIMRPCGTKFGNYLVLLYMFTKLLYIANVIGQLFILNGILATRYNMYGFDVFDYYSDPGLDWHDSPGVAFPRVTMCDFQVRRLGNLHRYTVQCTLPINMYNEVVYAILWFWMVFVAAITCLDLLVFIMRYFMKNDKILYLRNHINFLTNKSDRVARDEVERFYDEYLRQDGVFLLRLIGHNTTNTTVTEIITALWQRWSEYEEEKSNRGLLKRTPSTGSESLDPDSSDGMTKVPPVDFIDDEDTKGDNPEKAKLI